MDKSKKRERFAMRGDDLIYVIMPQNEYNHVRCISFHNTMFFLCSFLSLSVEIIDTPKASPGEYHSPVSKTKEMAKNFKRSKNVKAGGKKKSRAVPLLDRSVDGALNIFEDAAAPTETPAARSPEGNNEELGLVALFGEGAANDALLESSVDDHSSDPDPAPRTPAEETTPAPSARDPEDEEMEVDNSVVVNPAAPSATDSQTGNMTAIVEAVATSSRVMALQVEVGISSLRRRREVMRRAAAKKEAQKGRRKRKMTESASRDGEASTSREVAPKAKMAKGGREPLQTGAFSDARSRLDAARGSDPLYAAERKGRLEAMRRGDTLVKVDATTAKTLPLKAPTTSQTKKLAATRKAAPATPSAAPRPMAPSADPSIPRPIRSSTPSSPRPSTSSSTLPAAASGSSPLPRPSKRFKGKEPGVGGSDEVLQGREGHVFMRELVDHGEIWKRENEEARKKLEALEREIVATEQRVVLSQEQMDICEENWNLYMHGTRKRPLKLQRAMEQATERIEQGLPYSAWRSGPRSNPSGKGKGKGIGKGKSKGKK